MEGKYNHTVFLDIKGYVIDWIQSAFRFNVLDSYYYSTGKNQINGHGDLLLDYRMGH